MYTHAAESEGNIHIFTPTTIVGGDVEIILFFCVSRVVHNKSIKSKCLFCAPLYEYNNRGCGRRRHYNTRIMMRRRNSRTHNIYHDEI